MEQNLPEKYQPTTPALKKIGNSINITNKILLPFIDSKEKELEIFLKEYLSRFALDTLSKFYTISQNLLEENKEFINWNYIFENENIKLPTNFFLNEENCKDLEEYGIEFFSSSINFPWSEDIIEKYKNEWDWDEMSTNENLPWSIAFILKYENKWNWNRGDVEWCDIEYKYINGNLSSNLALPWSELLIDKFLHKWNWYNLSRNANVKWSIPLIEKYFENLNWAGFSKNLGINYTEGLIDKYHEYWWWDSLSRHYQFSDATLIKYGENIQCWWNMYYYNKKSHFGFSSIYIFKDVVDNFPDIDSLFFTEEIIIDCKNNFDLFEIDTLSIHKNVAWSISLLTAYVDDWYWPSISKNPYIPWSTELISLFEDKIDFIELSSNESVPWSYDLILRYVDKLDANNLSENKAIPWSIELISMINKSIKLDVISLCLNPKMYDNIIRPYINDVIFARVIEFADEKNKEFWVKWQENYNALNGIS